MKRWKTDDSKSFYVLNESGEMMANAATAALAKRIAKLPDMEVLLEKAAALIAKGMAENAYDGIVAGPDYPNRILGYIMDILDDKAPEPEPAKAIDPKPEAPEPAAPEPRPYLDRAEAIARIKKGLESRSGKKWSVTGGRGTAYGWLTITAPPKRRTWRTRETGAKDDRGYEIYEPYDAGEPGWNMSPDDTAELSRLLDIPTMGKTGDNVPSSNDYYWEYVDRAEGRTPTKIAEPYWD